eukprot:2729651-Prymnesium_polylepis.2
MTLDQDCARTKTTQPKRCMAALTSVTRGVPWRKALEISAELIILTHFHPTTRSAPEAERNARSSPWGGADSSDPN